MSAPHLQHSIRELPDFGRYERQLALWLSGESDDDDSLEAAGEALCAAARRIRASPESLLIAIRGGRATTVQEGTDRAARTSQAREHRYTLALNLLMKCYFA